MPYLLGEPHPLSRRCAADPSRFRAIADHIRAASFAIADGATPSNVEAGYVVRRMIRRAVRYGKQLGLNRNFCGDLWGMVVALQGGSYPRVRGQQAAVAEALDREETGFAAMLERGPRECEKVAAGAREQPGGNGSIAGEVAFKLFDNFGFPLPLTVVLSRCCSETANARLGQTAPGAYPLIDSGRPAL